jgi:hypothetical protein
MEFKIINTPTESIKTLKTRKLICRLIGCNSTYIYRDKFIGNYITMIPNPTKCTRCGVYYKSYNKSVLQLIKDLIYRIKQTINE